LVGNIPAGDGKNDKLFYSDASKNTKASVQCTTITSFVLQVGFTGLSPSSQQLLLQLEAVYALLQSLSTSPASQASVTQYSEQLSGQQDMKAADGPVRSGPAQVVSQDVEDQLEAEDDMPEDEKKEAAEQNNEAKSEATAPTPLPDLVTCHQPLGAPVAIIASGISCHGDIANEVNRRLPDLVLSGLRRPPEERNLSAGRRAVIINTADLSDIASVGNDAAATAANTGELCLRPPVGRLSSHPVLPAAKSRRRRSFRIGHAAERHGAAAGGTDVLRRAGDGGGFHHPLLLRRAVVWRQAGAELATIADGLMAVSGGGRLIVAVANPRQLAAANQRINIVDEEEERMDDVMMDSWEGLLLAVMARAVLYACLSRLKRLLF
jgi:hypothetical protein